MLLSLPEKWQPRLTIAKAISTVWSLEFYYGSIFQVIQLTELAVPEPKIFQFLVALQSTKRESSSKYWQKQNSSSVGGFRVHIPRRISKTVEENKLQFIDSMMCASYLFSYSAEKLMPVKPKEARNSPEICLSQQLTPQFLIFYNFWQEYRHATPRMLSSMFYPSLSPFSWQLVNRTLSKMRIDKQRVQRGSLRTRWHSIMSLTARQRSWQRAVGHATQRVFLNVSQILNRASSSSMGNSKPVDNCEHLPLAVLSQGLVLTCQLMPEENIRSLLAYLFISVRLILS